MSTNMTLLWGRDTEAIKVQPATAAAREAGPAPAVRRGPERGVTAAPTLLSMLVERTERQVGGARKA